MVSNGAGRVPSPSLRLPSRLATAWEGVFSGSMQWITSVHPRWSKAQSIEASAPSVAYPLPQAPRARPQPTSGPGQASGFQGPRRPIHWPEDFSITENMAKPNIAQAPATLVKPRQEAERGCGPPMKREPSASCIIADQGSKSSRRGGRRIKRSVSRVGPSMPDL